MATKHTAQVELNKGGDKRSRLTKLWMKGSTLRVIRYSQAVREKREQLGPFYFELVDRRRTATANLRLFLSTIQIFIFAAFALSLAPIGADGHNTLRWALRDLREILIVISALIGLAIGFISYHHDVLTDIISAEAAVRSRGDSELKELVDISYGLKFFPLQQSQDDLELAGSYGLLIRTSATLAWITAAFVVAGSILIRVKVLEDIYFVPTFSVGTSLWVIGFALITDILGLLILILNAGPVRALRRDKEFKDATRTPK